MVKKVGIIGFGSIGKEIIAAAKREEIPNAKIVALFDKEPQVISSAGQDNAELHLFSDFNKFYESPVYSSLDIII